MRPRISALLSAAAVCLVAMSGPAVAESPTQSSSDTPASPRLTVSLTFDDGFASAYDAAALMHEAGFAGTFYVNTDRVGDTDRLTWPQVEQLDAMGHEIGGHTSMHVALPGVPVDEQLRQVCRDRNVLIRHGFAPRSFAYPFGAHDAASRRSAENCGYGSARATGGLSDGVRLEHAAFSVAERDPYALPALPSIVSETPATLVERWLDDALAKGGWTILVMHEMCADCGTMAVRPEVLAATLRWLQEHSDAVAVRTVGDVIGGPVRPTAQAPEADTTVAELPNAGLAKSFTFTPDIEGSTQPGGNPVCWSVDSYGSIAIDSSRKFDRSIDRWVQEVAVRERGTGDAKLIVTPDSGGCAPAVRSGQAYDMSVLVKSDVPTRFVTFLYRDGEWTFYRASPWTEPADGWQRTSWTTPDLPDGATRMSFGLAVTDEGLLSTTGYELAPAPFRVALWVVALGVSGLLCLVLVLVTPFLHRRRAHEGTRRRLESGREVPA